MGELSLALAVFAMVLHASAFVLYSIEVNRGSSKPNPASWGVWAFLAVVNAASFSMMADWVASMQFFVGSAGCVLTFLYALFAGKFSRLEPFEQAFLIAGIIAVILWWYFRSAELANLIVVAAIFVSFWPTLAMVMRNPKGESALPWRLWTTAFGIMIVNLILTDAFVGDQSMLSFVAPALLFIAHGAVASAAKG